MKTTMRERGDLSMPTAFLNGVNLFYDLRGKGDRETIVFLNGVAMSTDHWAAQTSYFENEYRVLLHDFRGQGRSSLETGGISFEQHARDLESLMDLLGIEQAHLVGVSYGAEVGMVFALNHPGRVKTLVLGTAVSESRPLLKAMVQSWISAARTGRGRLFFEVMAPLVYSATFFESQREWLERRIEAFDRVVTPQWFEAFIALCENFLTLDVTDRLNGIRVPTLLVSGSEDILKPVGYSRLIQAHIPHSELVIIDGAGHALFHEQAQAFNDVVSRFVRRHALSSKS